MRNKNDKYTALLAGLLTITAIAGTFIAADSLKNNQIALEPEGSGRIIQGENIPEDIPNMPIEIIDEIENLPDDAISGETDKTPKPSEVKPASAKSKTEEVIIDDDETVSVSVDGFDIGEAVWPVSSRVVVYDYSYKTSPVYSVTFKEYRSDHSGVDIRANLGEEVKCVYSGKVSSIYDDPKLGKTITIDHGNSIFSIYANLSDDIRVKTGEKLEAGKVMATVGASAKYEIAEEPHLHFGVEAFGDYVDPLDYIGK